MMKALWKILRPGERREALRIFLWMVITSGFEMLGVGIVLPVAMFLVNPRHVMAMPAVRTFDRFFGISSGREFAVALAFMLLAIIGTKAVVVSRGYRRQFGFLYRLQKDLSDRLLAGYMAAPYAFHLARNSTDLLKNVRGEIPILTDGVLLPGLQLISESVVSLAVFALLMAVSPALTLGIGAVLGVAFIMVFRATRARSERLGRARQDALTSMFRHAATGLAAIKDLTVLDRQDRLLSQHEQATHRYSEASAAQMVTVHMPRLAIEALAFAGLIGILLYAQWVLRQPQAAIPLMAMYAMAVFRLMPSFTKMLNAAMSIRFNRATIAIVAEALAEVGSAADDEVGVEALSFAREITLRGFSYAYPGSTRQALDGIDLTIAKGSSVAFVGPSGAGKSTLADVLLGLLQGQGDLLVDGEPLRAGAIKAWRRQIGYVPQQVYLADDTIAANVAFGVAEEEIDRGAVARALETAQLARFVADLPAGIDTRIGDHGTSLSGGQRQRLGIARALYHDPSVLVLDEATSALDGPTEADLTAAITALAGRKTLIVIAHRLSTVASCDQVVLLEGGRVMARGEFAELARSHAFFQGRGPLATTPAA
ncbi:ABC transporter ATP-binding protein [Acidiferrobacter sp.]|uniref:ABC transporter ATP-binding protein n=1 Tax=Acidiferrobacter sp. TaxID=1872107 RepID=UPI002635A94F|nr:ABC transporter ATP-binding protein [Acidiferrobacter sp.]